MLTSVIGKWSMDNSKRALTAKCINSLEVEMVNLAGRIARTLRGDPPGAGP